MSSFTCSTYDVGKLPAANFLQKFEILGKGHVVRSMEALEKKIYLYYLMCDVSMLRKGAETRIFA
jgi:hypothetical protein